jgi:hypothetical protein
MKYQGKGWRYENYRHSLAAKGIRTKIRPISLYARPPYMYEHMHGQEPMPIEEPIKLKKEEYETIFEKGTETAENLGGQLGDFIFRTNPESKETAFEKGTTTAEEKGKALGDKIFRGPIRF